MKRFIALIMVTFMLSLLFAASVKKEGIENPFPSLENLEAFDFERQSEVYPDMKINLITTETGDEIYSYFGHTSLELILPSLPPLFYDYGYFSFSNGFYINFIFGRLLYNVYATDGAMRLDLFEMEDRTVHRTELKLSNQMKNAIFSFLRFNTREENNTYLYDYYLDNCATRVRDIYNEATGGDFKRWAEGIYNGTSLRRCANLYLDKNPIVSFTLNYLEGPSIDKPISLYEECFLPLHLMEAIEEYEMIESDVIITSEGRNQYRTLSLNTWTLIFSLSLYLVTFILYSSKRRWIKRIADMLMGILYLYLFVLSAVLLFMISATNHTVTYFNANLLYINPLIIIMAAEAIRGRKINKRYWYSIISLALLALAFIFKALFPDVFIQDNLSVLMLSGSIYLINITRFFIEREKQSD